MVRCDWLNRREQKCRGRLSEIEEENEKKHFMFKLCGRELKENVESLVDGEEGAKVFGTMLWLRTQFESVCFRKVIKCMCINYCY